MHLRRVRLRSTALALLIGSLLRLSRSSESAAPFQLESANFTSFIDGLPSDYGVLMEYYAHWCPTCQHFQPVYDGIARYLNAEPRVKPEVAVARVDCATQNSLCNEFSIARYPTLLYGFPVAFKPGAEQKREEYTGERTALQIIGWLGEQRGVAYNFDPSQEFQEERRSVGTRSAGVEGTVGQPLRTQADAGDIEKATVLAFKYALDAPELLKGQESRRAFNAFAEAVAAAHPIDRCRNGTKRLHGALQTGWPEESVDGPQADLKGIAVCGEGAGSQEWSSCKGSRENTRGYTCALWMLLHSLAGRMQPRGTGGQAWMAAVRGYVQHFFQCSDCAKHFTEMASEAAATSVRTQKEAVLWAWRAHNEVNRRLEAVERSGSGGDPAFPKLQWPPSELCPLCRLPALGKQAEVTWNEEEVYRFLLRFYEGLPEQGWVTNQLENSGSILSLGSRRSLEGRGSSGRHHFLPLLVAGLVLAGAAFAARQRMRRGRKIISL